MRKEEKIPCGRTEVDSCLCCRRHHKWYNTRLVIEKIRICKEPIKRRKLFIVQGSVYCRVCGSCVESFGGATLHDVLLERIFGPFI